MTDERDDTLMQLFSRETPEDTGAYFVKRISDRLPREMRRRTIVHAALTTTATMIAFAIALINLDTVSALGNAILYFATELSHYPLVVVLVLVLILPIIDIVGR